jgi:hypothetical protein
VTAWCDGGYATNLALEDVTNGRAWVVYEFGGESLHPEHGGPARLLVPHLYFWRSAKWVRGLTLTSADEPGFWEPTATTTTLTHGTSSDTKATELAVRQGGRSHRGTPRCKSFLLETPAWPGHRAAQHVDVRLTAEDGYQAQRSYSIASGPEDAELVLTIERLDDGEVSPYLVDELGPGDELELRGPIGGYFVWERSSGGPLLLIAGGSGVVPFRAHAAPPLRRWQRRRSTAPLLRPVAGRGAVPAGTRVPHVGPHCRARGTHTDVARGLEGTSWAHQPRAASRCVMAGR